MHESNRVFWTKTIITQSENLRCRGWIILIFGRFWVRTKELTAGQKPWLLLLFSPVLSTPFKDIRITVRTKQVLRGNLPNEPFSAFRIRTLHHANSCPVFAVRAHHRPSPIVGPDHPATFRFHREFFLAFFTPVAQFSAAKLPVLPAASQED